MIYGSLTWTRISIGWGASNACRQEAREFQWSELLRSFPTYISLLVIVVVDDIVGLRCRTATLHSFSHTMLVLLLVNLDVVDA